MSVDHRALIAGLHATAGMDGRLSRRAEFGMGATFKEKDVGGNETMRNAIHAAGGDPSKYIGSNWDAESIRTVEDDRNRSQRDWD